MSRWTVSTSKWRRDHFSEQEHFLEKDEFDMAIMQGTGSDKPSGWKLYEPRHEGSQGYDTILNNSAFWVENRGHVKMLHRGKQEGTNWGTSYQKPWQAGWRAATPLQRARNYQSQKFWQEATRTQAESNDVNVKEGTNLGDTLLFLSKAHCCWIRLPLSSCSSSTWKSSWHPTQSLNSSFYPPLWSSSVLHRPSYRLTCHF